MAKSDLDDVRLTVAGVAARLGVAAPTLRTWDRRYGLGPSDHVAGSHRRYGSADLARLQTMRRLTLEGVAPADAARIALRAAGESEPPEVPEVQPEETSPVVADPLTVAAAAIDGEHGRLTRLIRRAIADQGVLESWVTTIRPALELVAERTSPDRPGHDPDTTLRAQLLAELVASDPAQPLGTAVIHAASPYRTDAHVLAADLAGRGVRARVVHRRLEDDDGQALLELVLSRSGTVTVLLGESLAAARWVDLLCEHDQRVFLIALTDTIAGRRGLHRARTLSGGVHEIVSVLTETPSEQGSAGS